MDLALLEAQYGFVTPKKVLEALQRDAFQAKSAPWQEDIYEKPMNEVCISSGVVHLGGGRSLPDSQAQGLAGKHDKHITPFDYLQFYILRHLKSTQGRQILHSLQERKE